MELMEQIGNAQEKGNMSTLEQKVDTLMRYCIAESDPVRRHYHVDLLALLGTVKRRDARSEIDRALADLGVPDHLLGYAYLQTAIAMVVDQPDAVHNITGAVYPAVARRYATTAQLAERSIRHAIESGWNRCDFAMQQLYFGGKIKPSRSKPTNAEFIARIANIVRGQTDG